MAARLRGLICRDSASAWQKAGFTITGRDRVYFGDFFIVLQGSNNVSQDEEEGFEGWIWSNVSKSLHGQVQGVKTAVVQDEQERERNDLPHPNGVTGIDHVVLNTGNYKVAEKMLQEEFQVQMKRRREDVYPGITQSFFRPNEEVIIEVVGPTESKAEAPLNPNLWGITFVSKDLDETKRFLGDNLSKVRKAKQAGRQITTLRNKNLNISVAVAIMSPHVPSPKL